MQPTSPQSPPPILPRSDNATLWIVKEVERAIGQLSDPITLRYYVAQACKNLEANPNLPGDWYGEQVVAETVRLFLEVHPFPVTRELIDTLFGAAKGRDSEGDYFVICPLCSATMVYKRAKLTHGPVAQLILSRMLFKHVAEAHEK